MININLTNRVIVIEPDPNKLDAAIRTALGEARGVLQTLYLPDFETVPPIEVRVSPGKKGDNYKNGAHVVYHLLSPPPHVSLLAGYVNLFDAILNCPSKDDIPVKLVAQVVFGSIDKIGRWVQSIHYKITFRHALRAIFVSLLRQRAVLLPPKIDLYLPYDNGIWRGFELMPERLQEMAAVYYAGSGLEYGVDWSLCTYSGHGVSMKKNGIEQLPARTGKTMLVNMAMCTRWERLDELDPADFYGLKELANTNTIGLYLTYLYLKASDKAPLIQRVFHWIGSIPRLRIYVMEYSAYASRTKSVRSNCKKRETRTSREEAPWRCDEADRRSLKRGLLDTITEATKDGGIDPVLFARSLGRMSGRTKLRPNNWPDESVLPDTIAFDWVNQTAHWSAAFKQYSRMTNYADEDSEFITFAPFMHYLTVYLPIYFHVNTDSDASYPATIEGFNGFYFISRPFDEVSQKLPLPFVRFVREYYSETSRERIYTAIRKLYHFFQLILGRRELFGIAGNFVNPVLETDIPGTGGRPTKTTKTRLPRKAYWLALLYAYKIYDYVAVINQRCIDDAVFAEQYPLMYHNLDEDKLGMIDIRDIVGVETDRVVKFEGVEYEVNLVPSYFLFPTKLPLIAQGHRYVIRPHSITHLICTLETGIRNQHIQWLSYDFDKHVQSDDINTEDVYQLFVMTDKSNKSWTALTAGRVIKILREMRTFRDLVDAEAFNNKIYYENRKENSTYSPFKVLFAFNIENGDPYSDHVYDNAFKYLMVGLQHVLDHFNVDFDLLEIDDSNENRIYKIKPKLSPHSMRVTVVSEFVQFLNSEYVGRYITNQKLATIWYYTKYDADVLKKMQAEQQRGLAQLNRGDSEVRLIGSGGETINSADPNSTLAKAFKEDIGQAIADFGAVSSNFFDRETGIGIVVSNCKLTLSFEPTHICPFNRICPSDRHKIGYANRCNFCDYAIRTVDHLPALGCRRRDLLEELEHLESYANENADKLTEGQERDIDLRLSIIAEDLGSLDLAEKILEQNLRQLKKGEDRDTIHIYRPDAVLKNLEAMPFPDMKDEYQYLLARVSEVNVYPDETRQMIKMKLLAVRNNILANSGNIREMLKRGSDINRIEAQVYSLVNSIKKTHGLSLDQIAAIAARDIEEVMHLDHKSTLKLPDTLLHNVAALTVEDWCCHDS